MAFGGAALVLRGMLKQLGGLQMMIDALLRHAFRITNAVRSKILEDIPYLQRLVTLRRACDKPGASPFWSPRRRR
jgi:hypothetical protein